jgi:hypothetical protein
MITKDKYISETEYAVRHLFSCIEHYADLIRLGASPCTTFRHGSEEEFQSQFKEWMDLPEIRDAHEIAEMAREEYRAQFFSMHVISGSILHIAFKAIDLFATPSELDLKYSSLIDGCKKGLTKKAGKFGLGREIRGIPLGLIILAGRNQYNHIEDGPELDLLNKNIFEALAKGHDYGQDILDPAFELDNNGLVSYSSNIRGVLGWDSYESYISDINELLQ